MALVTDYDSLQTWVATVLNRDDLTSDIPNMIQDAEAALKDDERARLLVDLSPFSTTADTAEDDLPSDFDSLYAIAHEGPTYYGEIEIVAPDQLQEYKLPHGTSSSVPQAASILPTADGTKIRWGPTPNAVFDLRLQYWAKLTNLSDSNTTNRLLTRRPDIYRYAVLVESAPYLKDDARLPMWQDQLERRLNQLEKATGRALFSGTLTRRPSQSF